MFDVVRMYGGGGVVRLQKRRPGTAAKHCGFLALETQLDTRNSATASHRTSTRISLQGLSTVPVILRSLASLV
jgi:hypothetical protein